MVHKLLDSYDHYVSETYLRQFLSIPKHVFAYRKKEKLETNMPIKSICGSRGGDICQGIKNIYAIREILKNIEPAWNIFLEAIKHRRVNEANASTPKVDELPLLYRVSLYIAYLRCLSPTMIRLGQEQQERILNDYLLKKFAELYNDELGNTAAKQAILEGKIKVRVHDEEYYKARSVGFLGEFGTLIYQRNWEILVNISTTKFITSDTPFILPTFLSSHIHATPEDLARRKTAPIYLPLTPQYALLIHPEMRRGLSYTEIKSYQVKQYNKEIVKSACDLIISCEYDLGISNLVDKYRNYSSELDFQTLRFPRDEMIIMKQKHIRKEAEAFNS